MCTCLSLKVLFNYEAKLQLSWSNLNFSLNMMSSLNEMLSIVLFCSQQRHTPFKSRFNATCNDLITGDDVSYQWIISLSRFRLASADGSKFVVIKLQALLHSHLTHDLAFMRLKRLLMKCLGLEADKAPSVVLNYTLRLSLIRKKLR